MKKYRINIKKILLILSVIFLNLTISGIAKAALCSTLPIPANNWSVFGDPRSNIVMITYDGLFFGPEPFTPISPTFVYNGVLYTRGALLFTCQTGPSVFDYQVQYYAVSGPVTTPPPPVYQGTSSESRYYNCPVGQVGTITQTRTFERWSDGNRNYSSWNVSSNTCVVSGITLNPNRKELCPTGYTGYVQYKWVLKYRNINYQAYDADGKVINYTLSTPYQEEVLDFNNCKIIPTQQVETKNGSETVTCDNYYGVAKGTYIGEVIKYGTYTTGYNSVTQQTNTIFIPTSNDVSQCISNLDKSISYETIIDTCPNNQSGNVEKRRYYALDSNGIKTYLYGNNYEVFKNTCIGEDKDTVNEVSKNENITLLTNLSFSTTDLSKNNIPKDFFNSLKNAEWKANNGDYILNIIVDNLNPSVYNAQKVGEAINRYKQVVGSNANVNIVSVPASLDKYIGNGGLNDVSNKHLSSAILRDNNIDVSYIDLGDKTENSLPIIKKFSIKLY